MLPQYVIKHRVSLLTFFFILYSVSSFAQNSHKVYIDSLKVEAMNCFEHNDFGTALTLQQKVIESLNHTEAKFSPEYAEALRNYSLFEFENGQINDAIIHIEEVIAIFDSLYTQDNLESALSRLDLASYHSALSHYNIALEEGKKALQTLDDLAYVPQENYAIAVAKVSRFYEDTGDHEESLILALKALTLIENVFGKGSSRYAQMLDQLSYIYYERGDLDSAIAYCQESCKIFSNISPSPFYVNAVNDLAAYYCDRGDIHESITLGELACSLAKDIYSSHNIFYINTVNNLARYYSANGDVDNAIIQSRKALELCGEMNLNSNISYARSLGHLANFYSQKGDYVSAIKYAEESKPIFKSIFGDSAPGYANCLRDLARYYYNNKDYSTAIRYIDSANSLIQNLVLKAFSYMPSHERFLYWNWYKDWFYYEIPNFCLGMQSKDMATISYNSVLFSKGILLNTDVEEQRILHETDGTNSLVLYERLQTVRKELDMLSFEDSSTEGRRDSLSRVLLELSGHLSSKSNVYNDYIRKQSIKWSDVKNCLKSGEIAIEFVKVENENDCRYIALTLKKDYSSPHIIDLFSESQRLKIEERSYYRTDELYQLIWGPLKNELKNIKKIYFSPDGCLHRIGIENLPMKNDRLISESYVLYRLSSTRELMLQNKKKEVSHAVLFGGLDYNCFSTMQPMSDNNGEELTTDLHRSVSSRGGFSSLPATTDEVNKISQLLARNQVSTMIFLDKDGTEQVFKSLSGNEVNILHIATHGEYIPTTSTNKNEILNKIAYDRDITQEDLALTRSFIVMSGGNIVANPNYVKDVLLEDGLLTSYEISKLDFSRANLVVLSACKTANGDITQDGVLGLQRGFKKAGVNSIIMSLWEVADLQTQYLMTRFYHYYTSGYKLNIAFNKAKQDLKKRYGTSGTRPHWASFIILDALH